MVWMEVAFRILNGITKVLLDELFWVVVLLVAVQHWRIARSREQYFGLKGGSFVRDTLYATFFGLLGGIMGSFLLVITGVSLEAIGIRYIWPIALILMLISPRFLCFAYAGGIIALSGFIFGFPTDIEIPQLMALVAILHLVESFLILVSGHRGAVPVYTRSRATGMIVGGFTLQKFWPIPLMALISADKVYTLIPVLAALGYGDLAMARTPARKSRISARNLSIYSLILLGLAVLSKDFTFLEFVAALFAPLGHELIIYLGQKMEMKEKPIFIPPPRGLMALEAVSHTLAGDMGIKPGDIIYTLNGIPVNSKADLDNLLALNPTYLQLEYVSHSYGRWQRKTAGFKRGDVLGIIPVPEGNEVSYMELNTKGFLHKIWQKFRGD